MEKVSAAEESVKRTPMLFIIIIMIVAILFAAPPVKRAQLAQGATIPENFQYWSEQQQLQYFEAQKNQASPPIFMYLFPTLSGALGYFLFSLIMRVFYT